MSAQWEEIYSDLSDEELATEIADLKESLSAGGYSAQSTGSKSYNKDLVHLQARLQSAIRVKRKRGQRGTNPMFGTVNFGNTDLDDF